MAHEDVIGRGLDLQGLFSSDGRLREFVEDVINQALQVEL
jgi:hypothetical protein